MGFFLLAPGSPEAWVGADRGMALLWLLSSLGGAGGRRFPPKDYVGSLSCSRHVTVLLRIKGVFPTSSILSVLLRMNVWITTELRTRWASSTCVWASRCPRATGFSPGWRFVPSLSPQTTFSLFWSWGTRQEVASELALLSQHHLQEILVVCFCVVVQGC